MGEQVLWHDRVGVQSDVSQSPHGKGRGEGERKGG